jgi:flagellar hook-associated protein FlgK
MTRIESSTLTVAQKGIDTIQHNIGKSSAPQSHRIESIISTSYGINGDYFGVRHTYSRAANEYLSKSIREAATKASSADTISNSLQSLELSLSAGDGKGSNLVESLSHFTSKINSLIGNNDPSMRESFLLHSRDLASTISQSASKINELRFEADRDLANAVSVVNNIIQNLSKINKSISLAGGNGINLHDDRDIELNKLAEYFDIKVNFGANGEALVRTKDGTEIISSNYYAQLNYTPLPSIESILQQGAAKPVTLSYSNSCYEPISVIDAEQGINKITGGKIAGFIKLRDVILPESHSKIQSFTKTLVDEVNRIYNMGSSFPPKTKIEGGRVIGLLDKIDCSGKATIAILDGNGRPVEGSSGKIKPLTIDFDNLAKKDGVLTTKDLLTELNAQLGYAPTRDRLRLGAIRDSSGAIIPGKSLLNDIKIRAKSDIVNGNFTFDLDLDGNELFGSKVEVLEVSVEGGAALPEDGLPSIFSLKKGEHLCTNQPITVNGIALATNIKIKLRVTGDNGVVEEGTANFRVDPASPDTRNKRIAGVIPGAPAIAGNQMVLGGATHAAFARAKLIDENGVEITGDLGKTGRLVIESISDDCRLVIQEGTSQIEGKGFKHFFEFNNFFGLKQDGTIDVLVENPEDLSIGTYKISKNPVPANVKIGSTAASAEMVFDTLSFVGAPNVPDNGDHITIDGVIYNFVNHPVVANDVAVGANLQESLQNLVNKINATRNLSSKVSAALNVAGDGIIITAKNLGESGNSVQIQSSIDTTINGNVVDGGINTPLIGGTNIDQLVDGDYLEMGNDSKQVLKLLANLDKNSVQMGTYEGSLHNCASITIGAITNQVTQAKTSTKVTLEVLKQLDSKLKEEVGINKYDERMKLAELGQYYQANLSAMRYANELWKDFFNFINRI